MGRQGQPWGAGGTGRAGCAWPVMHAYMFTDRHGTAASGTGQKAQGVLLPSLCLFSPKNTLKIPLKLDAELPALALADCIYAGIRVLLLKFMHAYIYTHV